MNADPRPGARLPSDPDYWERLSARVTRAAFEPARPVLEPWWGLIADRAFALAAAAAFALLGGSLLLNARTGSNPIHPRPLVGALAPEQPLLSALLDAGDDPSPGSLLFRLMSLREVEE